MNKGITTRSAFLFFCAFLSFFKSNAITYYISPTGNDDADGTTAATAWRTVGKVNTVILPPGTIVLFEGGREFRGGLYVNSEDGNNPSNNIVFSTYGSGRAIIRSDTATGFYANNTQGITITNLIFEGSGTHASSTNGMVFYVSLSNGSHLENIFIQDVEIRDYGKAGILFFTTDENTGYKDVVIDGAAIHHVKQNGIFTGAVSSSKESVWAHKNFTVKNTVVNNIPGYSDASVNRGGGIVLGYINGGWIEKCVAHHNGLENTHCGGPGGIWAYNSNNITIQYCESYNNSGGTGCDGFGFDLDGGVTNSVMQYNYSHDNAGAGYMLGQNDSAKSWYNNTVRYNITENDARKYSGAISLFKGGSTTMHGAKIYNNTVYISPSPNNPTALGAITVVEWHTGIEDVEVYNNIFQTTGGASLVNFPSGYSGVFIGNLYWSSGGAFKIKYQGNTYSSLESWRAATGNEKLHGAPTGIAADPLVKNAGNGGIVFPDHVVSINAYFLVDSSPAVNAGLDLAANFAINPGEHDYFGNPNFSGPAPDIGIHEYPNVTASKGDEISGGRKISFYPNPVRSGDFIMIKTPDTHCTAELISLTGATVWKKDKIETRDFYISTTNLAAGSYLLSITDANGYRKTAKVILQ